MNPDEIKIHCRQAHRAEQDLPKVKWAAFQEQRRREDLAAIRFQKKQARDPAARRARARASARALTPRATASRPRSLAQADIKKKTDEPNPVVVKFLASLRKCLTKKMKETGGTEHSVIRQCFLNWDADCSGELSVEEFEVRRRRAARVRAGLVGARANLLRARGARGRSRARSRGLARRTRSSRWGSGWITTSRTRS